VRFLVTGGAGFIGSNLAKRLSARGDEVVAVDDFSRGHWANLANFAGDVVALKAFDDLDSITSLGPFDAIFHQASMTGVVAADGTDLTGPDLQRAMLRNNVETFRGLLNWAAATKARMIWASSCSIYGRGAAPMRESQPADPLNVYAFSKMVMERLAAGYATKLAHPIVGLRYTNVYGPGEDHKGKLASMVHQLAKQMRGGRRPRIFKAGEQKRDFVYIDDCVEANLCALKAPQSGVFNVGCGRAFTFNQLVAELNRALKTALEPEYFDNPYGFTQDWTEADLTQAGRILGYKPRFDLATGIDAYLASGQLGTTIR
jgi:ADP-L-glycero-D-manno-heptose 6-epimerase